jgi:hypothetical protein
MQFRNSGRNQKRSQRQFVGIPSFLRALSSGGILLSNVLSWHLMDEKTGFRRATSSR